MQLRGKAHEARRLAIALWMHLAAVPPGAVEVVATALLPQDHARGATDLAQPSDQRWVVAKEAIAVQLDEAGGKQFKVGLRGRAIAPPR